jgi:cell division protein FtsB
MDHDESHLDAAEGGPGPDPAAGAEQPTAADAAEPAGSEVGAPPPVPPRARPTGLAGRWPLFSVVAMAVLGVLTVVLGALFVRADLHSSAQQRRLDKLVRDNARLSEQQRQAETRNAELTRKFTEADQKVRLWEPCVTEAARYAEAMQKIQQELQKQIASGKPGGDIMPPADLDTLFTFDGPAGLASCLKTK